jgi:hypothetical protein
MCSAAMKDRYRAALLLSAFGDAVGYKNSSWEFNTSGILVHKEYLQLTKGQGTKAGASFACHLASFCEPLRIQYSDCFCFS